MCQKPDTDLMLLLEDYQILLTGLCPNNSTGSWACYETSDPTADTKLPLGKVQLMLVMCKAGSLQTMCDGLTGKHVAVMAESISPILKCQMSCSLPNRFPLLAHIIGNKRKLAYEVCTSVLVSNIVKISNAFLQLFITCIYIT